MNKDIKTRGSLPDESNNQPIPPIDNGIRKKSQYSFLGVVMAIVFGIVIIMFVERTVYDINRFINPAIDKEYTEKKNQEKDSNDYTYEYEYPNKKVSPRYDMSHDSASAISKNKVYFKEENEGRYMMFKAIIYSTIIVPIFILSIVLFYIKKYNPKVKPILVAFISATSWLMLHLLIVILKFVMQEYKNVAIYFLLGILAIVFGFLTFYIQSRHNSKKEEVST